MLRERKSEGQQCALKVRLFLTQYDYIYLLSVHIDQ